MEWFVARDREGGVELVIGGRPKWREISEKVNASTFKQCGIPQNRLPRVSRSFADESVQQSPSSVPFIYGILWMIWLLSWTYTSLPKTKVLLVIMLENSEWQMPQRHRGRVSCSYPVQVHTLNFYSNNFTLFLKAWSLMHDKIKW